MKTFILGSAKYKNPKTQQFESLPCLKGDKGESGNINYPTFDINGAMELVMTTDAASDADRFKLDEHGNLTLNI